MRDISTASAMMFAALSPVWRHLSAMNSASEVGSSTVSGTVVSVLPAKKGRADVVVVGMFGEGARFRISGTLTSRDEN